MDEMHHRANFIKMGHSTAELLQLFRMAAVRHLGFGWGLFEPPTKSTW